MLDIMALIRGLAYISLPFFGLRWLSGRSDTARYYTRVAVYFTGIGVFSAYGFVLSFFMALVGRRFDIDYHTAQAFTGVMSRIFDIKPILIEGKEYLDTKPAVIVANHQSMLDILQLGPVFPRATVIMSKKELRWVPMLGVFMMLGGTVFVDRSNHQRAIASLEEAGETMKRRKNSLWIFPEGTRRLEEKPDLKPFKKGAFHIAIKAGLPIVPIVFENYWKIYHQGVFNSGTVKVKVLPPIETTGLGPEDVADLAIRTREIMLKSLLEFSESALGPDKALPIQESSPVGEVRIMEVRPHGEASGVEAPRQRTASRASRATNGSNGSAETEEEDGHVLVRRPPT